MKYQKKDYDGAVADATQAISLDSKHPSGYGTRAWARYSKGDIAGAAEDCKKAVELFKADSALGAYNQGLLDFINADYEKAIASWESSIRQDATWKPELQPWIEKAKAKLNK